MDFNGCMSVGWVRKSQLKGKQGGYCCLWSTHYLRRDVNAGDSRYLLLTQQQPLFIHVMNVLLY